MAEETSEVAVSTRLVAELASLMAVLGTSGLEQCRHESTIHSFGFNVYIRLT